MEKGKILLFTGAFILLVGFVLVALVSGSPTGNVIASSPLSNSCHGGPNKQGSCPVGQLCSSFFRGKCVTKESLSVPIPSCSEDSQCGVGKLCSIREHKCVASCNPYSRDTCEVGRRCTPGAVKCVGDSTGDLACYSDVVPVGGRCGSGAGGFCSSSGSCELLKSPSTLPPASCAVSTGDKVSIQQNNFRGTRLMCSDLNYFCIAQFPTGNECTVGLPATTKVLCCKAETN